VVVTIATLQRYLPQRTHFPTYISMFFYQFDLDFMALFSTATFEAFLLLHGHFTATHGYKFSTVTNFFKLPHLRKVAVTTAT
jgi:hypothetical protein